MLSFFDMNTYKQSSNGRGLRALDLGIKVARFLLIVVTGITIPLAILAMSGRGDMFISATLDDPYAIEFADGQRVDVSDGVRSYSNSEIGKESESITDVPVIQLSLKIKRTDLASRGVFLAFVVGLLAAAWVGVINLGRIVQSTIAGRPFADENPRRLRWLGGAVLALPAIDLIRTVLLDRTLDVDLPVSVSTLGPVWALVLVGIGMFALAEVFVEAARLRRFEEDTI
jgi:hypothetical protein